MKKIILIITTLLFATFAQAMIVAPTLCSVQDHEVLREANLEMQESGFDNLRYDMKVGYSAGDCTDIYSLQRLAEKTHKVDSSAPPRCAIIFILESKYKLIQARWILNTLGNVYTTKSSRSIQLCAKVEQIGPLPGVTTHN